MRGIGGLALLGGMLTLLVCGGLAIQHADEQSLGSPSRVAMFVALALISCLIYGIAVLVVMKQALTRAGLWVILAVAVAIRLVVAVAPPFLSTDLYRYVWDGRMQIAGINPYLYPPAAPELTGFRDTMIFPKINRPDYARTIYPPVAQFIFRVVATVWPSIYGIKAAMVLFDLVTIGALLGLLHRLGRKPTHVLIYAWHPLPVWEFAGSGHIDAAAVCLVALALLAAASLHPKTATLALAAATLVKLLPVVLFPVIWRPWNRVVPLIFGATIAAGYLCYAGAGWHVLGFLPGYAAEESAGGGIRIYALAVVSRWVGALPAWAPGAYVGVVALGLLALGARIAFAGRKLAGAAMLLATALMVALSPHYPWYFVWLLVPCCLAPALSVLYLTSGVFLIYLASYDSDIVWASLIYLPFLLLAWVDIARFTRPVPAFGPNDPRSVQCL